MKKKLLITFTLAFFSLSLAQSIVISEVMSSNSSFLADESGWKYPDWIELYNNSNASINLKGFALSDSESKPKKWFFPDAEIEANDYLIVFADKENRRQLFSFNTLADVGAIWRYKVGNSPISVNWLLPDFDDSNWSQGPSGFGYGDNDDNTLIPASPSVFIRKSFNISDPRQADGMLIHVDYDDAYALYLNGELITKKNISDLSLYTEAAKKGHEANLYRGEHDFEEVWIKAEDLRQGENLIAIEAHNYSVDNSAKKDWVEPADLSIIPVVSLFYKYANPNKIDNPSAFVAAAYPHLHSNFSLKSGESVVLSNAQGQVVDKQVLLDTRSNESQGRASNSNTWGYLDSPSPKASNTSGYAKRAAKVKALTSAGLYDAALSLALEAEAGASIYYSLDGSEPNTSSNQYTGPINISKTSILRARAYRNNYAPSLVSSFTYFINEDNGLPIISLIADPIDLFSNQRGIFAYGSHAEANGAGANFKQAWTRASSVEYFLDAGLAFQADAGLELFGHYSRSKERKSMEVKFKDGFGSGKLKYPVFDDYPVKKFDDLVLRTSSNDYKKTLFRDMLTQSLFKELGLDTQAYKPARLFINAQYWGLINIREKMDSHYLERHFGVEDDEIDLIAGYIKENGKLKGQVLEGNLDSYRELVNFVKDRDMSDQANYNYISEQMDIDNFITYMAAQIYVDNYDWPGRNIKFWRAKGGKWRWLVYDTDFAFALEASHDYRFNSLAHILSDDPSPDWESQPNASLLLTRLLQNDDFKLAFVKKFYEIMSTAFEPGHVLARIAEFKDRLEPEMPRHIDRWGKFQPSLDEMNDWYRNIKDLEDFANKRPAYMQQHLIDFFGQDIVDKALKR